MENNSVNPFGEMQGSIPMEHVINADGTTIPFDQISKKVQITKEHWEEISKFVSCLNKGTVIKLLKESTIR
jgi:hypothetical protein